MLEILIRNIQPRISSTMQSITDETIIEWHRQKEDKQRELYAKMGKAFPINKIKNSKREVLAAHSRDVEEIWRFEESIPRKIKEIKLAEEYDGCLYEHWDTISHLYRARKDWKGYSTRPGFEDTPDDLLLMMKRSAHKTASHKALEHSARRVNLIRVDSPDKNVIEKRENGIMDR